MGLDLALPATRSCPRLVAFGKGALAVICVDLGNRERIAWGDVWIGGMVTAAHRNLILCRVAADPIS